jgi:hypothetical protein
MHHKHRPSFEERLLALECLGEKLMNDFTALEQKVTDLEASEAAREARDVEQDKVTAAQIATLTQSVKDLQAIIDAGTTNPLDQAKIDAVVARVTTVINSLNAADPTPPAA